MSTKFKKAAAVILAALFMLAAIPISAVNDAETSSVSGDSADEQSANNNNDNNAGKTVTNPERKQGEKPMLGEGETGILIDAASGNTLFEYNSGKHMYPVMFHEKSFSIAHLPSK